MNQRTYRAGEEVEDLCRACKADRLHTVIVVDGAGWPLRVQCDFCQSQHNYRGGARTASSPSPSSPRPPSPSPGAPALVSDRERTAPPMSLQDQSDDLELLLRRIIREEAGVTEVRPVSSRMMRRISSSRSAAPVVCDMEGSCGGAAR